MPDAISTATPAPLAPSPEIQRELDGWNTARENGAEPIEPIQEWSDEPSEPIAVSPSAAEMKSRLSQSLPASQVDPETLLQWQRQSLDRNAEALAAAQKAKQDEMLAAQVAKADAQAARSDAQVAGASPGPVHSPEFQRELDGWDTARENGARAPMVDGPVVTAELRAVLPAVETKQNLEPDEARTDGHDPRKPSDETFERAQIMIRDAFNKTACTYFIRKKKTSTSENCRVGALLMALLLLLSYTLLLLLHLFAAALLTYSAAAPM